MTVADVAVAVLVGVLTAAVIAACVGGIVYRPHGQRLGDLHARALPDLRASAARNPRLARLLAEIERGREQPCPPSDPRLAESDPVPNWTAGHADRKAARDALLGHCRPATVADLTGPAATYTADRPFRTSIWSEWHVLISRPGEFPDLYGALAVHVFVPAALRLDPGLIPRTFHGGCGHSTFWFEDGNVVVGSVPLWLPSDVVAAAGRPGGGV